MGPEDDRARAQEQAVFDDAVVRRVEQRTQKARFVHREHAQQHVAHLTHSREREAFLHQVFAVGHHGPHEHRDERQDDERGLHPGAPQQLDAEDLVYEAHDAQHARLRDAAGQQS